MKGRTAFNGWCRLIAITTLLSMLSAGPVWAQSDSPDSDLDSLRRDRDAAMRKLEENFSAMDREVRDLKLKIDEERISKQLAEDKIQEISELHRRIIEELDASNENYRQIAQDFKRYKFTEKTKHIVPVAAGVASGILAGDEAGEKVLIGFGVYGALLLLEDLGIGLGKPISNVLYPVFSW
jgi:hypothetical protein